MVLKLNISEKGKAWKVEVEPEVLAGKSIGNKVSGKDIKPEFESYEFEITGGSDFCGFPMSENVEGIGRKKVLLTKGWGMQKRPRGVKKKVPQPKGLRLRKTVAGNTISEKTIQVNMIVVKEGKKPLSEIFPEQNKISEPEKKEEVVNDNKKDGVVVSEQVSEVKAGEVKKEVVNDKDDSKVVSEQGKDASKEEVAKEPGKVEEKKEKEAVEEVKKFKKEEGKVEENVNSKDESKSAPDGEDNKE